MPLLKIIEKQWENQRIFTFFDFDHFEIHFWHVVTLFAPFLSHWGAILEHSGVFWSSLGVPWASCEVSWAELGRLLGRLGASWVPLRASWVPLRASWSILVVSLSSLRSFWSVSETIFDGFWNFLLLKIIEKH